MIFSSLEFIGIFLPILLLLYAVAGKRGRVPVLLIGSLFFYGVGEPRFIVVLIGSLAVNFGLCALMTGSEKGRTPALVAVLLWNFGLLFFFKYFDFFAENVNRLAGRAFLPALRLVLPLGISFYTFQMVSYQIDVYRGTQERNRNFLEFCLYVCFFPQLIAGPIVRYGEIEGDIRQPSFQIETVEEGWKVFTLGLSLKVLLANQIGTLFQQIQSIGARNLDASCAWLGAFAYSFQIYFDFWGYSLMAIGLGLLFGFHLPRNFNQPYMAKSVTDFWRRWHITLSGWFKDYVYIPLGGSRKGKARTICNLLIVWSLTGLWHGASWNFVLWGVFIFCLLVLEKSGLGALLERTRLLGHLYCMLVIPVFWIIFSQTEWSALLSYLKAMAFANEAVTPVTAAQTLRYLREYGALLAACFLCSTPLPARLFQKYNKSVVGVPMLFGLFWLCLYELYIGKNNPFLYFRF